MDTRLENDIAIYLITNFHFIFQFYFKSYILFNDVSSILILFNMNILHINIRF
jgi:hypothetical protein